MIGGMNKANAQLVDYLLGQKRETAHALMRDFKIVDYQKNRVVHSFDTGVHQTLFYENDTCIRFYWAVENNRLDWFKEQLLESGYKFIDAARFEKDSLTLVLRKLGSGKATMFLASIDKSKLTGERYASGKKVIDPKAVNLEPLPLLQQAILAEDNAIKKDSTRTKKHKDPSKHWVGNEYGKLKILGWDLD
ncbi:hypothetical protein ACFLR1_04595 [Bacteroidota bacterium]